MGKRTYGDLGFKSNPLDRSRFGGAGGDAAFKAMSERIKKDPTFIKKFSGGGDGASSSFQKDDRFSDAASLRRRK